MNTEEILRRTSRSFYLTLRLLPHAMRGDASLGYLLARAMDTIADTPGRSLAQRADILHAAAASLGAPAIPAYDAAAWSDVPRDLAERYLLAGLPSLWHRMAERPSPARARLSGVLRCILEGQIFDLERFGPGASPLAEAELERYTFLVAGSVGEFWTDLAAAELPRFSADPQDVMRARGRRYGQALQLVNILRDRRMDEAMGRVYVSGDDTARWALQAREWLGEAGPYCQSLCSGRLRYATLLPALLGWRTLSIDASYAPGELTPMKVSRPEVRRWMRRALPVWWSRAAVARLVREAAA
ncbi:MAG: squalene/phytoene synthase family protein [Chthoniobacterales bacterium]|jgi:farnesyl-diphosphate farnesyltransferase